MQVNESTTRFVRNDDHISPTNPLTLMLIGSNSDSDVEEDRPYSLDIVGKRVLWEVKLQECLGSLFPPFNLPSFLVSDSSGVPSATSIQLLRFASATTFIYRKCYCCIICIVIIANEIAEPDSRLFNAKKRFSVVDASQ